MRDPNCPFGAKEVGQGPLLPVMPAVANAIYDAVGVRIDEMPITPDKVLRALELKAQARIAHRPEEFSRACRIRSRCSCCRPGKEATATHPGFQRRSSRPPHDAPAVVRVSRAAIARGGGTILAGEGPNAMLIAGGTDLLPNMKRRHHGAETVVSLGGIEELRNKRHDLRRRPHPHGNHQLRKRPRRCAKRRTRSPRRTCATWARSAATFASTRAATTTTRTTNGARRSTSA